MSREKDLEISFLLDFYGELLSPEKREAARLYFDEDLSLAEIAQRNIAKLKLRYPEGFSEERSNNRAQGDV